MIDADSPVQLEGGNGIVGKSDSLLRGAPLLLLVRVFLQVALQVIVAVGLSGVNRSQKWIKRKKKRFDQLRACFGTFPSSLEERWWRERRG